MDVHMKSGLSAFSLDYRNRKIEGRTFTDLGFYPNASAVEFNDLLANSKSNTRPGIFRPGVEALEYCEYPLGMSRVDSDAAVADGEDPFTIFLYCRNMHFWRLVPPELDGVAYQILEQPYQLR